MREDLTPLSYPVPPNVNGLDTDAARDRVSDYLSELEKVTVTNAHRIKKARFRMIVCALINGFRSALGATYVKHYNWCPHTYWARN